MDLYALCNTDSIAATVNLRSTVMHVTLLMRPLVSYNSLTERFDPINSSISDLTARVLHNIHAERRRQRTGSPIQNWYNRGVDNGGMKL